MSAANGNPSGVQPSGDGARGRKSRAERSEKPLELRFVRSATTLVQLPRTTAEVAMVGRSNVGKSSLINKLAGRKGLAQVSKTPGRTRVINLFSLIKPGDGPVVPTSEVEHGVVDLPGYGYAAVSKKEKSGWPAMIESYLLRRESLRMLFVLVDGEIGPTRLDLQMLDWLRHNELPHMVVATKADKVKPSKLATRKREVSRACYLDPDDIFWVSVASDAGVDALRRAVRTLLVHG